MDIQYLSIEELSRGYQTDGQEYRCLFCGEHYPQDEIHPYEGRLLTAEGMVKRHITAAHTSPFQAILGLGKKTTGLSDVQIEMMQYFFDGISDKEIVDQSNLTSVSTVRQHRFKLREKEKQAKLFLALMQLIKHPPAERIHEGAKQVDERYSIEETEREKVLGTYFKDGLDGGIETIPSKEKKKLIVLQHIIARFEAGRHYTEREVNEVLKGVNADFVSLRRHLVEYGFMDRNGDGSAYWRR